ncbi:ABC transporter substrate-binding protein [Gardnerella vaginalis]|uniref:ABC transporter substrate-binding protein n=1 Tax=Gardnerella vaginalis TaxID=2702 RepID=UPI0039F0E667
MSDACSSCESNSHSKNGVRISRWLRFVAAFTSLSLLGFSSACGTSDAVGPDPLLARSYDVNRIKKDKSIAAMLPKKLVESGELVMGTNVGYAPAGFYARDGKTVVGYEIDLNKALAKLMGLKLRIVHAPFDAILPSVGSKFDIGVSGFTVSKEREKSVDFVTYADAGLLFVVRKGNPTNVNLNDLCGKKVSVQVGTTSETQMYDARDVCKLTRKAPLDVLAFREQTDATTAVVAGRADVMYADTPVSSFAIEQTDGQLEPLGKSRDKALMGIITQKGDTQLVEAIKAGIEKLIQTGAYQEIMKAWGVEDVMIKHPEVNPKV